MQYIYTPMYDIDIEMKDGEVYTIIGRFEPTIIGKIRLVGDEIPLYTLEEREKMGMANKDCVWIEMPYGDIRLEIKDGLVSFKKNDKIIFQTYRHFIKKCTTNLPETFASLE